MLLLQSYYLNLLLRLIILPTLPTFVMKSSIRCCISCIFPCGALDVIRIVHSNGRVEEITGTIFASDIIKSHPKHILKEPISRPLISDDFYFSSSSSSSSSHYPPPSTKLPRIIIVPPDTQLQRGKIYFLIPATTSNFKQNNQQQTKLTSSSTSPNTTTVDNPIRNTTDQDDHHHHHDHQRRRRRRRQSSRSARDGSGGDEFCNNKIKTGFDSESGDSITTHRRNRDQSLMNSCSSAMSDRYLSELLSENKVSTHRDRRRRGRVAVWRPHLESICESVTDSGGSSTTTSTDHRRHHSHQL